MPEPKPSLQSFETTNKEIQEIKKSLIGLFESSKDYKSINSMKNRSVGLLNTLDDKDIPAFQKEENLKFFMRILKLIFQDERYSKELEKVNHSAQEYLNTLEKDTGATITTSQNLSTSNVQPKVQNIIPEDAKRVLKAITPYARDISNETDELIKNLSDPSVDISAKKEKRRQYLDQIGGKINEKAFSNIQSLLDNFFSRLEAVQDPQTQIPKKSADQRQKPPQPNTPAPAQTAQPKLPEQGSTGTYKSPLSKTYTQRALDKLSDMTRNSLQSSKTSVKTLNEFSSAADLKTAIQSYLNILPFNSQINNNIYKATAAKLKEILNSDAPNKKEAMEQVEALKLSIPIKNHFILVSIEKAVNLYFEKLEAQQQIATDQEKVASSQSSLQPPLSIQTDQPTEPSAVKNLPPQPLSSTEVVQPPHTADVVNVQQPSPPPTAESVQSTPPPAVETVQKRSPSPVAVQPISSPAVEALQKQSPSPTKVQPEPSVSRASAPTPKKRFPKIPNPFKALSQRNKQRNERKSIPEAAEKSYEDIQETLYSFKSKPTEKNIISYISYFFQQLKDSGVEPNTVAVQSLMNLTDEMVQSLRKLASQSLPESDAAAARESIIRKFFKDAQPHVNHIHKESNATPEERIASPNKFNFSVAEVPKQSMQKEQSRQPTLPENPPSTHKRKSTNKREDTKKEKGVIDLSKTKFVPKQGIFRSLESQTFRPSTNKRPAGTPRNTKYKKETDDLQKDAMRIAKLLEKNKNKKP